MSGASNRPTTDRGWEPPVAAAADRPATPRATAGGASVTSGGSRPATPSRFVVGPLPLTPIILPLPASGVSGILPAPRMSNPPTATPASPSSGGRFGDGSSEALPRPNSIRSELRGSVPPRIVDHEKRTAAAVNRHAAPAKQQQHSAGGLTTANSREEERGGRRGADHRRRDADHLVMPHRHQLQKRRSDLSGAWSSGDTEEQEEEEDRVNHVEVVQAQAVDFRVAPTMRGPAGWPPSVVDDGARIRMSSQGSSRSSSAAPHAEEEEEVQGGGAMGANHHRRRGETPPERPRQEHGDHRTNTSSSHASVPPPRSSTDASWGSAKSATSSVAQLVSQAIQHGASSAESSRVEGGVAGGLVRGMGGASRPAAGGAGGVSTSFSSDVYVTRRGGGEPSGSGADDSGYYSYDSMQYMKSLGLI